MRDGWGTDFQTQKKNIKKLKEKKEVENIKKWSGNAIPICRNPSVCIKDLLFH